MNDILTFLVVFSVFLAVIVAVVVLFRRYARKLEMERTLGLKSSATLLGWQFTEEVPLDYFPNLFSFVLFSEGDSKQIKNLMTGERNGVKAALFDYKYTVGHGKHRHTHYQSVAYFEPRNLSLPYFAIRPESFLHKVITALGYQDIDFSNRPTFSSQYLLRGTGEMAIRNTFSDDLFAFYEANPGTSTDGGGNQLFIFRPGYRTPPHEAQSFIEVAARLQSIYSRRR
ncbi:MAG: hypothetical protein ACR2LM_15820 [Pyrinomonadaceae bacterium]